MRSLRIANVAPRTSAPYKCVCFGFIFDDRLAGREKERCSERERESSKGRVCLGVIVMGRGRVEVAADAEVAAVPIRASSTPLELLRFSLPFAT